MRIGSVANELICHHGTVIGAAISSYRNTRNEVRQMLVGGEHFIEVSVDTPLEVCEVRDMKGLYV
jgi:adenylylsulfate kinase-like enzyme